MSSYNRNPKGKNQHKYDEVFELRLEAALRGYHCELKTSNHEISELLKADYGIDKSASTVKRRRKDLGLTGGAATMKKMAKSDVVQSVLGKIDKDPAKRMGDSVILPRKIVWEIMQEHDKDSFALREPTAKKVFRVAKYPIGIHQRWSCNGHDKMYKIGYPIWAIVDDAAGKILKAWEFQGMPIQTTTDCGSETTLLYGIVNTLRDTYHSDIDSIEVPPHVYLRSVHNISVEWQWLRLRLDFGDNCVIAFNDGVAKGYYNSQDPEQYELSQWLWPRFIQAGLDEYAAFRNSVKMRKESDKPGPSAMSCNTAFSLPEKWGGRNCLLPVDVDVIAQMKRDMSGDALIAFSTPEFAARAQIVYDSLHIQKLTEENIWHVFLAMLPVVFPQRVQSA
ncbi:hypothetical protein DFH07DRAFT_951416 [Mycena maculata]|uniref:Uncharacterized protein n=1 Tax=Mycena maculata TaxID=230809 RepID=A0AAD7NUN1_9AGAR|nr:hypothetical protein DFH07DRAFT_951416 [Mycena maculata]